MKLKEKNPAPDFKLPDQNGKTHSLSDYHGTWLLLYFYPNDDTPGCTKEACNFRDSYEELKNMVEIIGISANYSFVDYKICCYWIFKYNNIKSFWLLFSVFFIQPYLIF